MSRTCIMAEAINWAIDCGVEFHSVAEALDWAIDQYQFNLDDEDCTDRKAISRTIRVLRSIRYEVG